MYELALMGEISGRGLSDAAARGSAWSVNSTDAAKIAKNLLPIP
jgi:hypothetical protein